jgi:hypothetical protein
VLFERRQARDTVGQPGSSLVEQDQAAELGEALDQASRFGKIPGHFPVRDPAGHEHDVDVPLAHHLVPDIDALGPHEPRLGKRRQDARSTGVHATQNEHADRWPWVKLPWSACVGPTISSGGAGRRHRVAVDR